METELILEPLQNEQQPTERESSIPMHPLPHDQLWTNNTINFTNLKSHLRREGRLLREDVVDLVSRASEFFRNEPNLLILKDPIVVCGDIHGQFFDLLRLFEAGGDPAKNQYLFLGDYVDRGCFSMECLIYLYALKLSSPYTFWMLRGNHECRHLTLFFNFRDECVYKYDLELWELIMDSFDCLPISATVNGKFLAIHGGLSPDIHTLEDISSINRFQEIPREGPFCDLMWADPVPDEDKKYNADPNSLEKTPVTQWFSHNETRQCSYYFGVSAVANFLESNELISIIRAHEACFDGYKFQFISKEEVPRVITIFSAPNYCDVYKNKAACIKFHNDVLNIRQYSSSPHPYYLPNFMDVISWSMPFLAEKVCLMLTNVLAFTIKSRAALENDRSVPQKKRKQRTVRDKIIAVTKMIHFYHVIQQENENIVKLKALTPSGKLPVGILGQGPAAIERELLIFTKAKEADKKNMKLPRDAKKGSLTSRQTMRTWIASQKE